MPHELHLRRRVQFAETDAAGIVHFSWFPKYMEEAEHALWRSAGLSIHPPDAEVGFPRVALAFQFLAPLRFEDEFDVHITIAALGAKTIDYACEVVKDGTVVARGTMTVICVRPDATGRPRAADIPVAIAERLSPAPAGQRP